MMKKEKKKKKKDDEMITEIQIRYPRRQTRYNDGGKVRYDIHQNQQKKQNIPPLIFPISHHTLAYTHSAFTLSTS